MGSIQLLKDQLVLGRVERFQDGHLEVLLLLAQYVPMTATEGSESRFSRSIDWMR